MERTMNIKQQLEIINALESIGYSFHGDRTQSISFDDIFNIILFEYANKVITTPGKYDDNKYNISLCMDIYKSNIKSMSHSEIIEMILKPRLSMQEYLKEYCELLKKELTSNYIEDVSPEDALYDFSDMIYK